MMLAPPPRRRQLPKQRPAYRRGGAVALLRKIEEDSEYQGIIKF
jgi:hypothetical protein